MNICSITVLLTAYVELALYSLNCKMWSGLVHNSNSHVTLTILVPHHLEAGHGHR